MLRIAFGCLSLVVASTVLAQSAPWRVSEPPLVSIGSLDGPLPTQLERVFGALRLPDGRVVIGNSGSSELRFFDARGQFLHASSRKGAGPGEFGAMSSIRPRLFGPQLIVDDNENRRVNVFDGEGKFQRTFRLEAQPASAWTSIAATSRRAIVGMSIRDSRLQGAPGSTIVSRYHYAVFDTLGTQQRALFDVPSRTRLVHAYQGITHYPFIPFSPEPLVAASGDRVFLLRNDTTAIEVWSVNGTRTAIFTWPGQRTEVRSIWQRYKTAQMATMTGERDRTLYGHFYDMELPLPRHVPVASQLQVDPAGNLWVERFRLPWDTERRWDVLDERGRFLGTVQTPFRVEVFQIGPDFLIGRARDDDEVEQVRVYRLSK
jgi:hypothetical protein